MTKKRLGIIALSLVLMLMAGCGEEEEPQTEATNAPAPIEEEVKEKPAPVQPVEAMEEEKEEQGATVLGNGSYFIKVNDRVYFREYDETVLSQDKLFGNYRSAPYDEGSCTISYIEGNDSKSRNAFTDNGYGPLYFYGDRFYLTDGKGVYSVMEDGSDRRYESLNGEGASILAICDHYLFYDGYDNAKDARCLSYKDLNSGEQVNVMPIEDSEWGYPEIKQVEVVGDEVYADISYMAGTGWFFQSGAIMQGKMDGSSQKAKVLQEFGGDVYSDDDWFDTMYFTVNDDGSVKLHHHKPLSAWAQEGKMMICNEHGDESVYAENYDLSNNGWFVQSDEGCSYVDGKVYIIRNIMRRCAENDVGWREAFNLVHSTYEQVEKNGDIATLSSISVPCEDILAYVWILNDLGRDRQTQVLYEPVLMVGRNDKELCDRYGLDPDSPDQFFDDYEMVEPYEGQTFIGSVSNKLRFMPVNITAPSEAAEGDLATFETYMRGGSDINYARVVLGDLRYLDEGTYTVPESNYDTNTFYKELLAKISFNEDGTEIVRIKEYYVP